MNHGNHQDIEFNPRGTRPPRRGPSWIMIFVMALLAFWFIQRNRKAQEQEGLENRPAAGVPELPDQRPREPRGGALDRAFGDEGAKPTDDPTAVTLEPATGRSGSSTAKTTRGDWSLEEVEVKPSATSDPPRNPQPKKTQQGDWELEID